MRRGDKWRLTEGQTTGEATDSDLLYSAVYCIAFKALVCESEVCVKYRLCVDECEFGYHVTLILSGLELSKSTLTLYPWVE